MKENADAMNFRLSGSETWMIGSFHVAANRMADTARYYSILKFDIETYLPAMVQVYDQGLQGTHGEPNGAWPLLIARASFSVFV